jgi:hypothetical protein
MARSKHITGKQKSLRQEIGAVIKPMFSTWFSPAATENEISDCPYFSEEGHSDDSLILRISSVHVPRLRR